MYRRFIHFRQIGPGIFVKKRPGPPQGRGRDADRFVRFSDADPFGRRPDLFGGRPGRALFKTGHALEGDLRAVASSVTAQDSSIVTRSQGNPDAFMSNPPISRIHHTLIYNKV